MLLSAFTATPRTFLLSLVQLYRRSFRRRQKGNIVWWSGIWSLGDMNPIGFMRCRVYARACRQRKVRGYLCRECFDSICRAVCRSPHSVSERADLPPVCGARQAALGHLPFALDTPRSTPSSGDPAIRERTAKTLERENRGT
jgi:hypothetical protein